MTLVIAGEGSQAEVLRELAANLGLADRVVFLGQVRALRALMQQASVFVLSSRYEGFPNVLLEALASGVAIVSTSCRGGPCEILRDGEFGVLVPPEDPAALAQAIVRVATDEGLRQRLANARSGALSRYQVERVVTQWEQVLAGQALHEHAIA